MKIITGLLENLLRNKWVFVNKHNTPFMRYQSIHEYWNRILLACSLRHREAYQMRNSFACNSLLSGFELSYVQMMLGHSSLEMIFKIYGNYIPKDNSKNGFNTSHFWENIGKSKIVTR